MLLCGGVGEENAEGAGPLLSLGHNRNVELCRKRAQNSVLFVPNGESCKLRKESIDILPYECLFEILGRLPGVKERSVCARVS